MEEKGFTIIDEDKIPLKKTMSMKYQSLADMINSLPPGKALMGSERTLKMGVDSVRKHVERLREAGRISSAIKVAQRENEKGDDIMIYIVNPSKRGP